MLVTKESNRGVHALLIEQIRNGRFSHDEKLPPEEELAEMLQISRTQLRDVLSQLESAGYISRRRGLGTIINRHVFALGVRADIETEFRKLISNMGMTPGVASVEVHRILSDDDLSDKLSIRKNSPLFCFERVITADGVKVIYCKDYLPYQHIKNFNYSDEDLTQPIFNFLDKFCEEEVYMQITRMNPVVADEKLAALLDISKATPLMRIDEVAYSFHGVVLFCTVEYYTEPVAEQTLLRRGYP